MVRLRRWAERIMAHPVVEGGVVLLILLWVAALIGEHAFTEPGVQVLMQDIGDILHFVFAIELLIRFWIAPSKVRFIQTYYLDILAIIPLSWVRPLRLLRLLRVGAMVRRSAGDLAIVATLSMFFVLGASMLIDAHENSVALSYDGTLGGLWFALYTFVGGEPIGGMPLTEEGRSITLVLMIGGMTLFGMFIGAVSASMGTAFARRMEVSDMEQLEGLRDHVVVCGWNLAGPTMLQELFAGREKPARLVVVTEQDARPEGLDLPGVRAGQILHVSGDYTRVEVLERVNIRYAAMAILLTDTLTPRSDQDRDARTVLAALTIERMKPDVFCCAELTSWEHAELLRMAGVEEIVVRDWYAGVIMGSMGRTLGLAAVLKDILSTSEGNAFHKLNVRKDQVGLTVGQLHTELKVKRSMILVALEREGVGGGERNIIVNPSAAEIILSGDVIVVIGPH
jgi:voltage-gated potassium channel